MDVSAEDAFSLMPLFRFVLQLLQCNNYITIT